MSSAKSLEQIVVSHRWLLTEVRTPTRHASCQASFTEAWLNFAAGGQFGWSDTINYISGHYAIDGDRLQLRDIVTTSAAYGGQEPERLAVMDAFRGLHDTECSGAPIAMHIVDGHLVISFADTALTFRRAGRIQHA
jgi:hypothetical protein